VACILILRKSDGTETYYLSGTGFQAVRASATTYSTKEASLVDGETQREALGPGALLAVQDQSTGEIHPIPALAD
jgi:hypothetical protein